MARTAQQDYAAMLRTEIAPPLRALGFKGSGASYMLPDDDRWLIVGFQKDRYSRVDRVRFTVNLTAADKHSWAEARAMETWLPERPSGNMRYLHADVIRLGDLMPPHRADRWWEIGQDRPSGGIADEVVAAIEGFALPWFRWQRSPN